MALNWLLMPEEALMFQTASPLILKLSLFLMTAVATHLVMSLGQTLLHYKVATIQLAVSCFTTTSTSITPIMPTIILSLGDTSVTKATLRRTSLFLYLVGGCAYFLLPLSFFVVMVIAGAASFYAHVFFDKEYHVEGSRLHRFAWFRRQQELHFVHHRHANSNFGVIHFFWDKILGTYRTPDAGA
jgi:fatty acid hydroxylase family protein